MTQRTRKREVGLMKLASSDFLSLVKSPANKTGFKVIRKDDKGGALQKIRVRKKATRSDSSLLAISFPEGINEEDAIQLMETFDLGEEYSVYRDEDGNYILKRTDADNADFPQSIEMGNGFTALIDNSAIQRSDKSITGVTLVGFEFTGGQDKEEIEEWLALRDIEADVVVNGKDTTVVNRHATKEETRKVKISEGVYGSVIRSEKTDVPEKVYRAVVDASYGNWGWGHLNFATALADPEFTDKSWDAIYVLRDVMENIILYSGLPLDERKTLVQNACEQFASYIGGLMDALPKGLIEKATTSDKTVKNEDSNMADKDKTKVDRSDSDTKDTKVEDKPTDKSTPEYVTREDLTEVVAEAVTAAMEAHVERTDEHTDKITSALSTLGEAVGKINENVDKVTRSMKDVEEEVKDLGGETTVSRSDEDGDDDKTESESVKRGENTSVFAGMFGDRFK